MTRTASAARVAMGQIIPAYLRLRTPYNALIHGTTAATILRSSMRRLVWLTVLAIALAVPAVGYAVVGASSDDGTLSVKKGIGKGYPKNTRTGLRPPTKGQNKVHHPTPHNAAGFK